MISFTKFAGDADTASATFSALPQEAFGLTAAGVSQGQQFELVVRRHEPARRLAAKTGRACCGKMRRFLLDFRRSPATTSAACGARVVESWRPSAVNGLLVSRLDSARQLAALETSAADALLRRCSSAAGRR
jgi:hypothetical protein